MKDQIKKLHLKYAAKSTQPELHFDLVWNHSVIVSESALQLANRIDFTDVNLELVEEGALVHDIGMYVCYDEELNPSSELAPLKHVFEGAKILEQEGIELRLQRFCLTHTATGLKAEDVEREALEVEIKDYLPVTIEEEIVCYADKFHTKNPSFSNYNSISERISRFDPDRKVRLHTFRKKYGLPDLTGLEAKYAAWATEINEKISALSN